ncbi:hypothetical protein AS4_28850 [Acinetobacter guillouiae]|uniref:hypothetical protein n=1 Tax=Acinetobacter guillouiae TaxID=106649 RepID=UPI0004EF699A|nr:hypothetical protein [Acinetobacter guillouiae]BAP37825.1 hypothetical protein AS4_28850 [Acinetobacter guillouiae]
MTTINNLTKHDSPEFKVGDLVVLNQSHSQNRVLKIQMFHEDFIRAFVRDSIKYSFGHKINFRHATLEEIKAGHRIDDNTDHITDIRNHVSPSTIVKDLEAERHG